MCSVLISLKSKISYKNLTSTFYILVITNRSWPISLHRVLEVRLQLSELNYKYKVSFIFHLLQINL